MSQLAIGSKYQVYNGTALQTSGGLTKSDIVKVLDEKSGIIRYKSKKQHSNGSKSQKKSQKARALWTKATKKAYKYLQSPHEDEKGIRKITKTLAEQYRSSFISMKKAPLTKKTPSLQERLYIVTKMMYDKTF